VTPVSTIDFFGATQVLLEGKYWAPVGQEGKTLSYLEFPDEKADKVEPAILVYTDSNKRAGFELYYYKADKATKKDERLVVYFTGLQPREFYRQ
jgi:hypothetical protein